MATNNCVHLAAKLCALFLILVTTTTGCSVRPQLAEHPTAAIEAKNPLATPVNPPYPGPYQTKLIDGVEYKKARLSQGKFGGTLVNPLIGHDPKTFNAWTSADQTSGQLAGYMWSALVATDPFTGDVIPDLAVDFQVMPDHVTYVTRLRKGLKWSDRQPITSDDVAYTFNTIVAEGFGNSSMRDVMSVRGKPPVVTVVDPLTNKFVTAKPFAPFVRALGSIPIAPKHILEPITSGPDARKNFDELWSPSHIDPKTLVTSGPFVLSRFVPGQRVEFSRTKNYYMIDAQGKRLPYLNRLVFLIVPNVIANLLKFKAGETDVTQIRNRDAVDLEKDQKKGNFTIYNLGQDASTYFVMFNLNRRKNDKGKPCVEPYKSAWFNDVNFRQAINHTVDRQQMINGYLKGIGAPLFTCEAPSAVFFNKHLQPFPPDPSYSASLLAKSGFQKKADGLLYDKDGHLVEFDLISGSGGTMNESIAVFIVNELKQLGMKVNYQEMEFNSLLDKLNSSKDWDACLFSLTSDPTEPNNEANLWRSDARLHLFDQRDAGPYGKITVTDARPWEKEIDDLFTAGVEEFDTTKRSQTYQRFQQIMYDQSPLIFLIAPMDLVAARNTVKNFIPTTQQVSQVVQGLHDVEEIYMDGGSARK